MKLYKILEQIVYLFIFSLSIIGLISLTSCSKKNYANLPMYQFKSQSGKPDYSNLNYWAAHPWKKNNSDSIPKPLLKKFKKDSIADVFFIYPTTLSSKKDTEWNAKIDDNIINAKTDYSTILYQASVFNEDSRIFAPRYRQANLKAFYIDKDMAQPYFDMAYEDIKTAFKYYLKNYNNGKPIIIASHSQGTKHAARLLKEFFEDKLLQKQLVCAYIIGLPVAENYFSTIKPCIDASSTGCFISWRTYQTGYIEPNFVAKETFKAVVNNPLSWTIDSIKIYNKKNLGGVLFKFNKIIPHVVSAQIHNNILWASKPKFFGNFIIKNKNYHIGDINLFYVNIRQNVKTRIYSFLKK